MDLSGSVAGIHMRTDANNLVTTAASTHLPEQQETVHLIQMLRREACSGDIDDLSHVRTEHCLSDSLTKHSAKPDALISAVETAILHQVDCHPLFRTTLPHKAFCLGESPPGEVFQDSSLSTPSGVSDYWELDTTGTMLTRHHVVPRRRCFSPWYATDCPVLLSSLEPLRESIAIHLNGEQRVARDSWINPHVSLPTSWIGRTVFHVSRK